LDMYKLYYCQAIVNDILIIQILSITNVRSYILKMCNLDDI